MVNPQLSAFGESARVDAARVGAPVARPAHGGLSTRQTRRIDWAIFLTVLVASLYVLPRWADPNQNSRLDMVVAVVEDRTFRIDDYVREHSGLR